jgi:very-short-patch-repair endonuclease
MSSKTQIFIQKAKLVHGDKYDYSKVTYINSRSKICIICRIHGDYIQKANNHLNGNGCSICSKKFQNIDMFIERATKVHNGIYDYSKFIYQTTDTKSVIVCPVHGDFMQSPHMHISGRGCPKCKSSKGELKILHWLQQNHIKYEHEFRFKNCRYKLPLPFDFYLPEHNCCIEFDGEQHYKPKSFGYDKSLEHRTNILNLTKHKDNIKDEYCHNNNIRLIRITYDKIDIINDILVSYFVDSSVSSNFTNSI